MTRRDSFGAWTACRGIRHRSATVATPSLRVGEDVVVENDEEQTDVAHALAALIEGSALWKASARSANVGLDGVDQAIIDSAVIGLTQGLDSAALVELAGLTAPANWFEVRDLLDLALIECQSSQSTRTEEETLLLALRFFARRAVAEEISVQELAAWACAFIGHDGAAAAQDVVALDNDVASEHFGFARSVGARDQLRTARHQSYLRRIQTFLDQTEDLVWSNTQ